MNKNILITSISSKVPLIKTIIESKNKFNNSIKVYGADISSNVVGKYFVDGLYVMPKLIDLKVEDLLKYCLENKIKYVIPTRDEDVLYYASFKEEFLKKDIHVFCANYETVNRCFDKFLFTKENGIDFNIKTFLELDSLKEIKRFVVKDRFGSGSKDLGLNLEYTEALIFSKKIKEPIFQEFIEGEEYSIDSYVDKNNKFIGSIIRKREIIQNGEAVVTSSIDDNILEEKIKTFLIKNQIIGHSITQVIKNENDYFLIECNTRFGGASTLSYKMGLESFYWFLCEVNNVPFKFLRSNKNYKQVRVMQDLYFEC